MKMYVILLIIFVSIAKAADSDESKYIDLLPDKEKEDLIEKVARRIIENIETKEILNKSSVEIPEDELKEHEAYVKQILKEESSSKRKNEINKANETLKLEDVRVKSLEIFKIKQRDNNLNLTIRSKRIKRNDEGRTVSEIPVKVATQNAKIRSVSSTRGDQSIYEEEIGKKNTDSQSSKEDIQVRNIKEPVLEHNILKTKNFGAVVNEDVSMPEHLTSTNENFHKHTTSIAPKDKFQGVVIEKPLSENIVVKTETGTEVREPITKMTDSIDSKNDNKHFKFSGQDVPVKLLKRRAAKNSKVSRNKNYTINETDIDNKNKSKTNSNDQQITTLDNFDLGIQENNMDESNQYETTDASSLETGTDDATVYNTTKSNESIETNQSTQAIYDLELESDKINSNEITDIDTLKDTTMTTETNILDDTIVTVFTHTKDSVSVKKNLKSNQKTSFIDFNEVNKFNNTERSDYKITSERNLHDRIQYSTTDTIISNIHKTKIDSGNYKNVNNNAELAQNFNIIDEITTAFKEIKNDAKEADTLIEQITIKTNYSEMSVSTPVITTVTVKNNTNINEKYPDTKLHIKKHYKQKFTIPEPKVTTVENKSKDTFLSMTEFIINSKVRDKIKNNNLNKKTKAENGKSKIIPTNLDNNVYNGSLKKKSITKDTNIKTIDQIINKKIITNNVINVTNDKYNIASKASKILREGLSLVKGKEKITKTNKNGNGYKVYEISADKSSFNQETEIAKEQPYYVPVYNYSPNTAYFNAENRLGPNVGDDLDIRNLMETEFYNIDDNIDSKPDSINELKSYDENMAYFKKRSEYRNDDYFDRSDNQKRKFGKQSLYEKVKPNDKNYKNQSHSILFPLFVQQPSEIKNNENYYNPNDYMDLEYSNKIARANCEKCEEELTTKKPFSFPNSDEESHPYKSIKEKDLKNHIRAVRNVLYEKQWFSNPIKVEKLITAIKKEEEDGGKQSKYYRSGNQRGIALDYYFERMKPKASKPVIYYKKVGFIKNNNHSDNIYMNSKFVNDNLIKYINAIKHKGQTYINEDYMTATPHTDLIGDVIPKIGTMKTNLEKIATKRSKSREMNTIQKILSVTDERDFLLTLAKLQAMNISLLRNKEENLNVYISVLKDMVRLDNNALQHYDWLRTTVDVQSALQKLLKLIESVQSNRDIHPSDLELLKYVIFLHKLSYESEKKNQIDELRKNSALPINKKKKKHFLNDKGLLDRVWLYLRNKKTKDEGRSSIDNLNEFLIDLQNNLFDLHEAMKNLALITKYKKQNWFKNLKELYIADDRSYLSILLHLAVTRLLELVEESTENGAETDFRSFVRENRDGTTKSIEEIRFIMHILDKIKEY